MSEILYTQQNKTYLPLPNKVDFILTDKISIRNLTYTAFMMTFTSDGSIVLANNVQRGAEVPGGHAENDETLAESAIRETEEEVGAIVTSYIPIGHLRMTSEGEVPDDYAYPHPISYQQFFAGIADELLPYTDNEECSQPLILSEDEAEEVLSADLFLLVRYAKSLLFK